MSNLRPRIRLLVFALAVALTPGLALAAETAITIPFSVTLVEPTAGGTTAALGPAKISFSYLDGATTLWAPFNSGGSYHVPLYDSQSDPSRFYGVKYPRDKYSLFYEHENIYTLDGAGFLHFYVRPDCRTGSLPCLIPGSYLVSAAHGFEFNQDRFKLRLVWDPDLGRYRARLSRLDGSQAARLDFRLGRVIDTTGYLGCDFHQHPSDGDALDPRLRLALNLANGIEVFGITAHDGYRYYHKLIEDYGVQDRILCVPSIELSTSRGHAIVLPQYGYLVDPGRLGPCDPYAEPAVACVQPTVGNVSLPLDLPYYDTPFFTLKAVSRQRLASGRPMYFFAAHPDSGYYTLTLDSQGTLSDPAARRVFRPDLDGVELRAIDTYKWMSLYNQGYRFSRLHDSDSHHFQAPGYTGSFIRSPVDSIPPASGRQSLVDTLVANISRGRSSMTQGPFLRLLEGAAEVSGSTLVGPNHQLRLRVQAPVTSTPPTTVKMVVNGTVTDHAVTYTPTLTPAGTRQEAELSLPLELGRDSWVMVMSGETSFATNAVWIDHDGNGTIDPLIPLPQIELTSLTPATASPGDQVVIEFKVTPAPLEVQAWVAPNDPRQNSACAADPNCDREALCLPFANGLFTSFRCTYRVSGDYPAVERPGPNEVRIAARGSNGYWNLMLDEIVIAYPDTDGDGMDDAWEKLNSHPAANPSCALDPGVDDAAADADGDGLANLDEKSAGTKPCIADTDGDAVSDGVEVGSGCSSPLLTDTDADGICDGSVAIANPGACYRGEDINLNGVQDAGETSACNADSDGDGCPDIWEKRFAACVVAYRDDGASDPDHDGLTNREEYQAGSNPCAADADGDGSTDPAEIAAGTDPNIADSDSDGVRDGAEAVAGTDPLDWDSDDDGLSDGEEKSLGTNPRKADTDGDGLLDGAEVHEHFSSPLALDTDGDGLADQDEVVVVNTLAYCADTDRDGLADGEEVMAGDDGFITDPLAWDSDADGLPDGFEAAAAVTFPPLDPLMPDDAFMDFDSDAIANLDEFWNGTDPWLPDPAGSAGCGYFGEGDGDGFIGPADASALASFLKGGPVYYHLVRPDNGETQEMDMDGFRGPGDLSLIRGMILAEVLDPLPARPAALERLSPETGATVAMEVGGTSHAAVSVRNEGGRFTPGLGVVFELGAGSTAAAELLGGEGEGGAGRYDLSGPIDQGGGARVRVRALSPGLIVITTRLPGCGGIPGQGRNFTPISGPSFYYQANLELP